MGRKGQFLIFFSLFCNWVLNLSSVNGATDAADVSALNVMYNSLNSPGQLSGWTSNGGDPCGQNWRGVTCSGSSVTELKLSGLGLSGSLGYQLTSLTSLTTFDVSNNNFGNDIPYQLPPNLSRLNLAENSFTGNIQYSIAQMSALQYLNIGHNQLQGQLSDIFGQLSSLTTLDLSSNRLNGNLPESFSSLTSLTTLSLQDNQFTGPIDVLANLPLQNLNVANNHFSGWIPGSLNNIRNFQKDGNSWTSGPAPPPPPYSTPPPGRRASPGHKSGGGNSPSNSGGGSNKSGLSGGGIAGIVITILVIGGILAFFLVRKRSKKGGLVEKQSHDQPFTPLVSNDIKEMKSIQPSSSIDTASIQPASIALKPPPMERHKSFDEEEFAANKITVKPKREKKAPISANPYSIADLQIATGSFGIDNLIGEGSIGRVYRAQFPDGKVLAVKKIDSSALPNQEPEEFMEAVSNISQLHHPNITELVGYSSEHGQYLLVYEFLKNGSLHDYLHLSDEFSRPLTWNTRVKIALGTARALEYLHEVCSPSVVHKNFKSANILLDNEFNPHLSDCGLGDFVANPDSEASNQNQGSGYSAPEVAMSGVYTMKSDVYSFGVAMLELLTGRKPFDSSKARSEQSLVRWATPQLHDIDALSKMVDPGLKELYPVKSLSRFADVVALCVQPEPEFRPPMSEVVQALVRLVQRASMSKRTNSEDSGASRKAEEHDNHEYSL
ncbi:protein STRUBBELIG-RECEPTOR FAMILY 7 isoform X1 [Amborella trichopoda]|uniref:Protein kinase domain-containing protein n=1 Tax=Amborella trichopoda TaxID=13333 RepID=W1NXM2_AMBTC|nr:protein STRUBBELIG-RECEPTOR FAMILY 7 isoform X1 [Amborella trichopoda]ERM99434.1 hypothetical protein AMTR_s00131p00083660 [Amborella trichopoda]|eukprot:XP_006836581.1 protein STRUBBELIG-RECEPTOR FAMILY 7 isoform X1 [Amborella trichopoda]